MAKRKAPSKAAMVKAVATFKRNHPGKPLPGFLRKYAGGKTLVNPIKRAQRKPATLPMKFRSNEKLRRAKSGVRVKRRVNVKRAVGAFVVDVSRNGRDWRLNVGDSRSASDASLIARSLGRAGYHARVRRR